MGGSDSSGALATVEAYGPMTELSATSGTAGATVTVTGTNFAAAATVKVYWGTAAHGTVVGTGATDASGKLATVSITVPAGTKAGTYAITVIDQTSLYPSIQTFTVTG